MPAWLENRDLNYWCMDRIDTSTWKFMYNTSTCISLKGINKTHISSMPRIIKSFTEEGTEICLWISVIRNQLFEIVKEHMSWEIWYGTIYVCITKIADYHPCFLHRWGYILDLLYMVHTRSFVHFCSKYNPPILPVLHIPMHFLSEQLYMQQNNENAPTYAFSN